MSSKINIIPYSSEYEHILLELERKAPQGSWIQLEMVRDQFLSRSKVFKDFQIFLGVTKNCELAGVAAGAIVPFEYNGSILKVGLGYDLKVFKDYRRQGLSKRFGKYLVEQYFLPAGIQDFVMTLKTSNVAVVKAAYEIERDWYQYPFMYLTIPTWRKANPKKNTSDNQHFMTMIFPENSDLHSFFSRTKSGLGIWKTYEMYQIKLSKLHPVVKFGQMIANVFLPNYRKIPGENTILKFATLFDFDFSNFHQINEVLKQLRDENIQYLNVCCQKGDFVWKALKPLAINAYPYTLLSTFQTKPGDKIAIDVRCL